MISATCWTTLRGVQKPDFQFSFYNCSRYSAKTNTLHNNSYTVKTTTIFICTVLCLLYKSQRLRKIVSVQQYNNRKQQKHRYNFYHETAMENAFRLFERFEPPKQTLAVYTEILF